MFIYVRVILLIPKITGAKKGKRIVTPGLLSVTIPFSLQKVILKKECHGASNTSIYFNPFWTVVHPLPSSNLLQTKEAMANLDWKSEGNSALE